MLHSRFSTVAHVARRATQSVRTDTLRLRNHSWGAINASKKEHSHLEPALYIVATPLGNLEDITLRALRVLQGSDVIYSEDCRHTSKLTNHYGINTPRVSYHQHNEAKRNHELVARLQQGQTVALVSDAGCPGVSDPGSSAVVAAIAAGCKVVPIPGASAVLTGLLGSGLSTEEFYFAGFLPAKGQQRKRKLEQLRRTITATMIFYVPPHKLMRVLTDIEDVFGPERQCCVARELTKVHEAFVRGSLREVTAHVETNGVKGEVTLLVEGSESVDMNTAGAVDPTQSVEERLTMVLREGMNTKAAAKLVSSEFNLRKKDVYDMAIKLQNSKIEETEQAT